MSDHGLPDPSHTPLPPPGSPPAAPPPPPPGPWATPPAAPPPAAWSPPSVRGRRVAAAFIDLVPPSLVAIGLAERDTSNGFNIELNGWRFLAAGLIGVAYWLVSELLTRTTLGKRMMGLTVVTVDGRDAAPAAIGLRNLFRLVDGLPAMYLVGFISMLATPNHQRVGDLVAKTRVVRYDDVRAAADAVPGPAAERRGAPVWHTIVLVAIAAVVSVVGVVTITNSTDQADRLGSYDIDADVDRYALALADGAFTELDADTIADEMVPGLATQAQITSLFDELRGPFGGIDGFVLTERSVLRDQLVGELDARLDVVEYLFDAEFGNGTGTLFLGVVVDNGDLKLLGWNINCETCPVPAT